MPMQKKSWSDTNRHAMLGSPCGTASRPGRTCSKNIATAQKRRFLVTIDEYHHYGNEYFMPL